MKRTETLMRHWHEQTSRAAQAFESRWTRSALHRVNADIAERLWDQRNLFIEACVVGRPKDIVNHGGALCRGYVAACKAMEEAHEPDDAYLLGQCPQTGIKVAIGHRKAAVDRIKEVEGEDVVWLSPDEVATLVATAEAFQRVAAIKRAFPGAEVTAVRYAAEGS